MNGFRAFLLILSFVFFYFPGGARDVLFPVTGKIVDPDGQPLELLTLGFAISDNSRQHVSITRTDGSFETDLPAGSYLLTIVSLGKTLHNDTVRVSGATDLGTIRIRQLVLTTEEVTVKREMITREADRFVMHVENSPLATGRDAGEILKLAPGVMATDRDLSIYGRSGTRVMINERLLPETGDELIAYLRNINAEDIRKIEVIPYAGAEYEASMTSGIVKITLKRKRDDGLEGSAGLRYDHALKANAYQRMMPSLDIKYRLRKWNFYSNLTFNWNDLTSRLTEQNQFLDERSTVQSSRGTSGDVSRPWTGRTGAIYDIDENHSAGIEAGYSFNRISTDHYNHTLWTDRDNRTDINSHYKGKNSIDRVNVSGNYIWNMDDEGGVLKMLLDFYYRNSNDLTLFNSLFSGSVTYDSVYRSHFLTKNRLYSAAIDYSKPLGHAQKISAGVKFNRNEMDNMTDYQFLNDVWVQNVPMSSLNDYRENINALYVKYDNRLPGYMNLSLGLRGEHTHTDLRNSHTDGTLKRSYFDLYPSANLMVPLGENYKHVLVFNYGRKVQRPGFSQLNPYRIPFNEFSFVEGNPSLKAASSNEVSATWVYDQKYTVVAGFDIYKDQIMQVTAQQQEGDVNTVVYRYENLQKSNLFHLVFTAPFELYKWWQVNTTLVYMHQRNQVNGVRNLSNSYLGTLNQNFTVREHWHVDLTFLYMSSLLSGNYVTRPMWRADVAVKRNLLENKLSVSLGLNDIFQTQNLKIDIRDKGYTRTTKLKSSYPTLSLSVRYNFKRGKQTKNKMIESGAADEASRL